MRQSPFCVGGVDGGGEGINHFPELTLAFFDLLASHHLIGYFDGVNENTVNDSAQRSRMG